MTFAQANAVCYAAGFRRNKGIVLMPCIGWAESRLRTDARHTNDNGTIDRGWLQINSIHTDISDADCDDPLKAAQWAFAFTSGGTKNYTAWSTYNSGAYKGPEGLVYNLFDFAETVRDLNHQLDDVDAVLADTQARLDAAMQTVADEKAQIAAGLVREAALNAKIDNAIVALQA
jgi:hypothetical protein